MTTPEQIIALVVPQNEVYLQIGRFLIVLAAGIILTRFVMVPFFSRLTSRSSSKKAKHQVRNLATIVGIFLAFTAALQAGEFGNLVTIIGTIAAALTVAVGFGMREEVGNLVSGVLIHVDSPFVKGDYISIGEEEGQVKEVNMRSTVLNGHASDEIMVPNGKMGANVLKNFTRGVKTKSSIDFKVSPEKTEQVAEIIKRLAEEHEEVLDTPEPGILYRKFEDDKNLFELRYWVRDSEDSKRVKSHLLEKFNREVVEKGLFKEDEDDEKDGKDKETKEEPAP